MTAQQPAAEADAAVVKVLEEEAAFEAREYQPVRTEFGSLGWQLKDVPEDAIIRLSKQHAEGEEVRVCVNANDHNAVDDEDGDGAATELDSAADVSEQRFVNFAVEIVKAADRKLVFSCRYTCFDQGGIGVLRVADIAWEPKVPGQDGREGGDSEDYENPGFEELDQKLQDSFIAYLTERGINHELGEQLLHVASDKEARCYMRWLKDVRDFLVL